MLMPLHARCDHPLVTNSGVLKTSAGLWSSSDILSVFWGHTCSQLSPSLPDSWAWGNLKDLEFGEEGMRQGSGRAIRRMPAGHCLNVHGPVRPSVSQHNLSRRGEGGGGEIWSTGSHVHCQSVALGMHPVGTPIVCHFSLSRKASRHGRRIT